MPVPAPNPSPAQLFTRWSFRAQRATTLQTLGIFHINSARLIGPATPPIPWVNPMTGRFIV